MGAGGNGTQRTFSIVCNWDETALGTAQALISLSGESVQRSATVAGSSLELMPLSSSLLPLKGRVGISCGCWGLQCSQQGGDSSWDRGRAGTGGEAAQQHLGPGRASWDGG